METKSRDRPEPTLDRTTDAGWYGEAETVRPVLRAVCTVRCPMNSHGAVTLESVRGHRTFQVVDCATSSVRAVLSRLTDETVVRVQLVPLSSRGSTWRAVGVSVDD